MHGHELSVKLVKVQLTTYWPKGVSNASFIYILEKLLKSSLCNGKHIKTFSIKSQFLGDIHVHVYNTIDRI